MCFLLLSANAQAMEPLTQEESAPFSKSATLYISFSDPKKIDEDTLLTNAQLEKYKFYLEDREEFISRISDESADYFENNGVCPTFLAPVTKSLLNYFVHSARYSAFMRLEDTIKNAALQEAKRRTAAFFLGVEEETERRENNTPKEEKGKDNTQRKDNLREEEDPQESLEDLNRVLSDYKTRIQKAQYFTIITPEIKEENKKVLIDLYIKVLNIREELKKETASRGLEWHKLTLPIFRALEDQYLNGLPYTNKETLLL